MSPRTVKRISEAIQDLLEAELGEPKKFFITIDRSGEGDFSTFGDMKLSLACGACLTFLIRNAQGALEAIGVEKGDDHDA